MYLEDNYSQNNGGDNMVAYSMKQLYEEGNSSHGIKRDFKSRVLAQ